MFFLGRTCTKRCFSSGKRSRIIASNTLPTNPVPPSRSIVLFVKTSIAEISPVPSNACVFPASYSPRTGFHRQAVLDFIKEPLPALRMEENLKTFHAVRESANSFARLHGATCGSDSWPRDNRPLKASERQPSCRKKRKTVRGRCPPDRRI